MRFPHLLEPVRIGHKTARNRVYLPPHVTLFANVDGHVTDRYLDYIEERARHGVGTISTGMHLVMPNALDFVGVLTAFDDGCLPGLSRLVEAIHRHGALALAQLNHTGRQTDSTIGRAAVFAPSPIPCEPFREVPKEMEVEDIAQVVAAFGRAARYVREAGYDGIEIHASTGYLIEQFLSPYSNRRAEAYGGSLENRRRFLSEVLDAVRTAWEGRPMILGVKLTVRQSVPGGLTLEEGCEVARWLDQEKGVDFIHPSMGPYEGLGLTGLGMHIPLGALMPEVVAVKSVLKRALTIANWRIKHPAQAEQILADGQADLISMARALIADPAFVAKVERGEPEAIRPCIGCDQECFGRLQRQRPISCLQNPAVGRESEWGEHLLRPAAVSRRVAVIGGGPAGLKAAEVAAGRGHRVSLYETGPELGGQARLAARAPFRQEFGEVAIHLVGQLERLGVDVHPGCRMSAADVVGLGADVVVIATGSSPARPELPGLGQSVPIQSVSDVLAGVATGSHVLLLDLDGHWAGLGSAEHLACQGTRVTFVTPMPLIGMEIYRPDVNAALLRLYPLGVQFTAGHRVVRLEGSTAVLAHVFSRVEQRVEGVDTIVFAGHHRPENELYRSLKGRVPALYAVGDCVAPRRATDAIFEGHQVGAMI